MSFVEGWGAIGGGMADAALIACVSGILVLVSLVAGVPALATALRFLRADRGIGKFIARLMSRRVGNGSTGQT